MRLKLTIFLLPLQVLVNAQPGSNRQNSLRVLNEGLKASMGENTQFGFVKKSSPSPVVEFKPSLRILPEDEALGNDEEAVESDEGDGEESYEYIISAFGKDYKLHFKKNDKLLPPGFRVSFRQGDGQVTKLQLSPDLASCHLVHSASGVSAAISDCSKGRLRGFVTTEEETFEIAPLLDEQLRLDVTKYLAAEEEEDLYIIRKLKLPSFDSEDDEFILEGQEFFAGSAGADLRFPFEAQVIGEDLFVENQANKTIELGIFLDDVAYKRLKDLYQTEEEVLENVLATINQVSAVYRHPSLGETVSLVIVRLEVMKQLPAELQEEGERVKLLKKFCKYSSSLNEPDDDDPEHWDLGVYLTGIDLFQDSPWGSRRYDTLGLAPTGGICDKEASCLAVEFGAEPKDVGAAPYPTTGFGAAYILAHEMGHSLGMKHDGKSNDCNRDGFIMSSSRETGGETKWSPCSAKTLKELVGARCLYDSPGNDGLRNGYDHQGEFQGLPGKTFGADRQCRRFLADKAAFAAMYNPDLCNSLRCKRDGTCLRRKRYSTERALEWSAPQRGPCTSACIKRSMGFRPTRQFCIRRNRLLCGNEMDQKVRVSHELCDDASICQGPLVEERRSHQEFATRRCSKWITGKSVEGSLGVHSDESPHHACEIYCKVEGRKVWIPALKILKAQSELSGEDEEEAFFPDGTWCHRRTDGVDLFCLDRRCQPRPGDHVEESPSVRAERAKYIEHEEY